MSKKNKIGITVLTVILLILTVIGFFWTFSFNLQTPAGFLIILPANQEQKKMYIDSHRKNDKTKKQMASCPKRQIASTETAENIVDSDDYQQMRKHVNTFERAANALKIVQTVYDIFGEANPDAVREALPFLFEKSYDEIMAMSKEADYAMIDAMCEPGLEWETKFWLSQLLGDRNAKEALPLFREIAGDEDEPFGLRVSVIDQIGILEDREASNLLVGLLDNRDDIIRDKASATLRDITDQGDERIYGIISSHYYTEQDATVKDCLLGSIIVIGGEKALPEIKEILKTATRDEKDTIAILLKDVHSDGSVEILKEMYDPQDEGGLSTSIISSLAKLGTEEANQFLYGIIEEVNGINSVMAADYLKDQKQKSAIPHIKKALSKETNEEFIKDYEEILTQLNQ